MYSMHYDLCNENSGLVNKVAKAFFLKNKELKKINKTAKYESLALNVGFLAAYGALHTVNAEKKRTLSVAETPVITRPFTTPPIYLC